MFSGTGDFEWLFEKSRSSSFDLSRWPKSKSIKNNPISHYLALSSHLALKVVGDGDWTGQRFGSCSDQEFVSQDDPEQIKWLILLIRYCMAKCWGVLQIACQSSRDVWLSSLLQQLKRFILSFSGLMALYLSHRMTFLLNARRCREIDLFWSMSDHRFPENRINFFHIVEQDEDTHGLMLR